MNLLIDNPTLYGNVNWFGVIVFTIVCGIAIWVLMKEKNE